MSSAIMAGLLAKIEVFNLVAALQLLRSLLWALLGAAMLLEWHENRRWYLMAVGAGACLCFAAHSLALTEAVLVASYSLNASNVRPFEGFGGVGVPLGLAGYACLFAGAIGGIVAHLGGTRGCLKGPENGTGEKGDKSNGVPDRVASGGCPPEAPTDPK